MPRMNGSGASSMSTLARATSPCSSGASSAPSTTSPKGTRRATWRKFDFRWNSRKGTDAERVQLTVQGAEGKRLYYRTPKWATGEGFEEADVDVLVRKPAKPKEEQRAPVQLLLPFGK